MPRHFPVGGEISGLHVSALPTTIENCSIANTAFHNNSNVLPRRPNERLLIREIAIHRCEHFACYARGAIFEAVCVTDIRGGGMARCVLWGCAFHRTRLRGWISGVMFRWMVSPDDDVLSRQFLLANTKHHESFDWALDITEASFSFYQDLLGIPAAKIRRDPQRHFVMTEASAREFLNSNNHSIWHLSAKSLIESGLPDMVIVTGGAGKKLNLQLEEALRLRDEGLLQ